MRARIDVLVRRLVMRAIGSVYMRLLRVLTLVVPDPGELDRTVAMLDGEEEG